MEQKKVIIVGAGPGGLTGAMILAHRGFQVTVYEKEDRVGGRNAPLKNGPYTFDTGPTFLMMSFILREVFSEAGRNIEDYLDIRKIEPMYHLDYGDLSLYPTTDVEKTIEEVKATFPGNEDGIPAFYRKEKRRFELLFPCLQKDYTQFRRFFHPDFIRAIPILGIGQSLYQNLGRYFNDDRLKMSFTFQSKYLGMSPWECPSAFTMIPYVERQYGIYHVIGGLNAISGAMATVAGELGAEIRTGSPVEEILTENGRATGVRLATGDIDYADEIIINADFGYAMTHLFNKGTLRKYTPDKIAQKKYSCSTFMLYLGIDGVYDLPHHNIYFSHDYRGNISDIFSTYRLTEEPSFYLQNPSVIDPTLAPPGKSTLYILVPVPNNLSGIDWETEKERFKEKVLDLVITRTSMKDLREKIEVETIITPHTWEQQYNVYLGATFNLAHNLGQMLWFRPRNKFEEVDNCYLVGGGTHPGSGLPTIYESGRITANLISGRHGVSYTKPSTLYTKDGAE
ncbi:MAG: phytoene desaturase [Methanocalculus sp. MSAO_Arc1]|uniref:phytoene desaturase family protein n=1 Tax=Methanocalculus TaxID=71151 RepID=UPI000FEDCF60|nr:MULTISPECIES: phytoene desaturase family protein [unclassified Methanocalculus]MCP1662152.1 phytoene desaturase [Methanocalculus sp. AMF5]RQD79117.1 MAG: phytoene desaturase [Methanocalculus sp. MSAO_Arc1]